MHAKLITELSFRCLRASYYKLQGNPAKPCYEQRFNLNDSQTIFAQCWCHIHCSVSCLFYIRMRYCTCDASANCTASPAPQADSHFAPAEAHISGQFGQTHSGFHLLERSDQALLWRLALIDSAKHSLDLQYYVWFGDTLGHLMMSRVIQAANRGVKVRILFDDLNTMLHDMTHVEMRDQLLSHIAKHPNIQIRVFNPWQDRSLIGRGLGMLGDFQRLNRRMHNKQMVADNRASIIGGRNLGDEYFGLNPAFNFHDLDVLGIGPVARQASLVFDRYWNSEWVEDIPKPATDNTTSSGNSK